MLSICITVYNQIDIVKWNLNSLIQYQGDNIEIIVSDDCSTDNILGLVNAICDPRVRYIKTPQNMGHDMNILFALDNCRGDYAWILRSRDTIYAEQINNVIEYLSKLKNVGYILFSANDENGDSKMILSDKWYFKGRQAIWAHTHLPIHPSGNIYNIEYVKPDKYRKYLLNSFNHNFGFVVHDLIRMHLCSCSDLVTSSQVSWLYSNTLKSTDVAVNSNQNKSIFSPEYEIDRFACIFSFIADNFFGNEKKTLLIWAIKRFYKSIVFNFKWLNNDKGSQKHYNYQPEKFDSKEARRRFLERLSSLEKEYGIEGELKWQIDNLVRSYNFLLLTFYPFKKRLTNIINGSRVRAQMIKLFKRI